MTESEKTEIQLLAESIHTFKKVAEDAQRGYFDEKVSEYAKNALKESKEIDEVIYSTINAHLADIVDFNDLRISTSINAVEERSRFSERGLIDVSVSGLMDLRFKVNLSAVKLRRDYSCIHISTSPDAVTLMDVRVYTSDTAKKYDDWEYSDIRLYSVVSSDYLKDGDYDLDAKHNAETWKSIYNKACKYFN